MDPARNRLLTTMALAKAQVDEGKDYVSNFEPIALEQIRTWPAGEGVEPHRLAKAISEAWSLPTFPSAVGKILRNELATAGYLTKVGDEFFPNPQELLKVTSLESQRESMLKEMDSLAGAAVKFAKRRHDVEWSKEDALEALDSLVRDFGADIALKRGADVQLADEGAMMIAHGFVLDASESDSESFSYLEHMIRGEMILSALYFDDVGSMSSRMEGLRAFLDTPVVLQLLGLADNSSCQASTEMLELMRDEFRISTWIFPHTMEEILGVLDGLQDSLRGSTEIGADQTKSRFRETVEILVKRGSTAGDIATLQANLEQTLIGMGVRVYEMPAREEAGHCDEGKMTEVLQEVVEYKSRNTRDKDVASLSALDRIRANTRPRNLTQANSIFVTNNPKLIRASERFFREEKVAAPVPHAIDETVLTSQLWVRSAHPRPDLPAHLLLADCFAALSPSEELWNRWIHYLEKLRAEDELTEEQVLRLVYETHARTSLYQETAGDPAAIDESTVNAVLDDSDRRIRAEAESETASERELRIKAETRADAAEDWKRTTQRRMRIVLGSAVIFFPVVAGIVLVLATDSIHGPTQWGIFATVLIAALVAGITIIANRGNAIAKGLATYGGGLLSVFAVVYALVEKSSE